MGLSFSGFLVLMLFVFSVSLFHLSVAAPGQLLSHDDECFALLQFKQSLLIDKDDCSYDPSFEYPKVESWKLEAENRSSDCCSWDGVRCDKNTGHVVGLNLSRSCLYGSINSTSTLFHLVHLQWLSLALNNFCNSKIPSEIKNLSKLSHLDLFHSHFSGQIPSEILELSHLEYLDLSGNFDLSGNLLQLRQAGGLPSLVEKLTNLKWLDLGTVDISSPVPNSLGNLSSLTQLSLYDCKLQGTVPSSIGNLTKLIHLVIFDNEFSDKVPISIGNLVALQELDVHGCQFTGQLPSSLGNLTQLVELDMHGNQFSGSIPYWLTNLNRLSTLDLSSNQMTGQIPSQISNLTQLISLDLSSNQLQGPIPSSIVELKNLEYLNLYSNSLSGTVELDTYLLKLESLYELILSSNKLSVLTSVNTTPQQFYSIGLGSCNLTKFPNFLQNQENLFGLDLSSNNIPGQIPRWLFNISKTIYFESLNLSNNLLTGFDQHPVVLQWTNLYTLDIRSNQLQGSLPLPPPSIKFYLASNNKLAGEIPLEMCKMNQLRALDLSYNNLSGALPPCFSNSSYNLSILGLQGNNFDGSIPETFVTGPNLKMIDLSNNKLQGQIPKSLANCTSLEFLNLGYNQITDSFPSWLEILPELKVLILTSNRFHGVITDPKRNFNFSKLQIIDLSHNLFMGELPSKYFQSWNSMKVVNGSQLTYMEDTLRPPESFLLSYFDFPSYAYAFMMNNKGIELAYGKISNKITGISLSGNKFTGEIPASISNLRALKILNLSNNNFLGYIPSSLGNLAELESLDLSNNKLSGKIPQQLVALTSLEFINVSHNNLKGRIPQGYQFDTFENTSFEGNLGLCGKPLSKMCEHSEANSQQEEDRGSESTFAFDWKIVLVGFVSGLVVGVILGNEFCTNITEWVAMNFELQLMRLKRRWGLV